MDSVAGGTKLSYKDKAARLLPASLWLKKHTGLIKFMTILNENSPASNVGLFQISF